MRLCKIKLSLSFITICIGGTIYILLRKDSTYLLCVVEKIGLISLINPIRDKALISFTNDFLAFNIPDGLWSLAYIIAIDSIIWDSKWKLIWAAIIPLMGVISEFLQLMDIIPGTFDIIDVILYLLPYIAYFILYRNKLYTLIFNKL